HDRDNQQSPSSLHALLSTCPSAAQARRTARTASPHALNPRITAPRVASRCPLISIHNRCSSHRFVPMGSGATSVHNSTSIRYTASGIGELLRDSVAIAPALYQRLPLLPIC